MTEKNTAGIAEPIWDSRNQDWAEGERIAARAEAALRLRPMTRLEIYDQLRQMHAQLKDIPNREDEWEKCVLNTVAGVLYMAESEFARDRTEERN